MLEALAVSVGVVKNTVGRFTVSTSSSNFLSIVFQTFRQCRVHHEPHISFVYSHTKGDSCDDNVDFVPHPL